VSLIAFIVLAHGVNTIGWLSTYFTPWCTFPTGAGGYFFAVALTLGGY